MQSTSFLCPYEAVFSLLQTIAAKKGYVITSADDSEGAIKAHARKYPFMKTKNLDIKITKVDHHTTSMRLMINNNAAAFDNAFTLDEFEEKRLLDTIHRYF